MIAYLDLCFLKDQATLFGISSSGSQEEKDCWLHPETLICLAAVIEFLFTSHM